MTIASIVMSLIASALGGWALGYWQGAAKTRKFFVDELQRWYR